MTRSWRNWFRRQDDDGIDEEIRAHLRMAVDERVARGESRSDAEMAARREFGNVTHVSEVAREMHRGSWALADNIVNIVAHAVRRLRRSPGYTVPVIVSLALGVGLNAAVFAVLDHAVRRPLPFPDDAKLITIGWVTTRGSGAAEPAPTWETFPNDVTAWRSGSRTIESFALFAETEAAVMGSGPPEHVAGAWASGELLQVLKVQTARGRWFSSAETNASVVVLSHSLWQRQFGGDTNVIGKVLRVSGEPKTVIGVMPPGVGLPFDAEYWQPMGEIGMGQAIARPRTGVSFAQVAAELQALSPRVANVQKYGSTVVIVVRTVRDHLFGTAGPPLKLLFGATLLLLLIACANVANLALTRTLERRRELAVRVALGAGRRSLAALVITENVVLAIVGAAFGVLLAWWGTRIVMAFGPEDILKIPGLGIGTMTVLFAAIVAGAAALAVSIAPVIAVNDMGVQPMLVQAGASTTRGASSPGFRRVLVAVQIATTLLLLTGSGLLIRSIGRLTRPDHLGFDPNGIVIASLSLLSPEYRGTGRGEILMREVLSRARALPGVRGVAIGPPPLVAGRRDGVREGFNLLFSVRNPANPENTPTVWVKHVDHGYADVYRVRLRAGRLFSASDDSAAPKVAILTASAVKVFFPDRDPLNQVLNQRALTRGGVPAPVVVGVVDDILQRDLAMGAHPEVLLPAAQQPSASWAHTVSVRSTAPPEVIIGALRQILKSLDPTLPATRLQSMQSVVDASLRRHEFLVRLLGAFAALGLALSLIGLYAVVSYLVTQRTLEIGVRMALGAQRSDVLRLVLREGAVLIAVGLGVGVPAAIAFGKVLAGFLFEVKPTDAATLVTATLSLALVALVAAWVPARRASGIDPASTLRSG
jgi:putative ABC transport system permease protein